MDRNVNASDKAKRTPLKAWYKDAICWLLIAVVAVLVITSWALF